MERRHGFGEDGIEYVAFIGLRGDEQLRTSRVEARARDPHANIGYEGEHVYMPLAKMHVTKENVNGFWSQQDWDLNLDADWLAVQLCLLLSQGCWNTG